MSWDLWGPPGNQVELEFSDSMLVQPQFYADFGVDVIEEDALNEMYCVQVLRILIAKADAEINELEDHLVSLQCQLAWEEHEDFYSICCGALKEKIDYLDASVRSMRNAAGDCANDTLSMHREPAGRTHEILKALLKNYYQKNHEKAAETVIGTSSLDAQDTSTSDSDRGRDKTDSDLKTACEELFQQPVDVIVKFNRKNTLGKSLEPKSDASGDSVRHPAKINTVPNSRIDMQNPKLAETDKIWGLSPGKEGRREDGKFYFASILQLQDRGSGDISETQTPEEEGRPAESVQLHDVTVHDESKWDLKLLDKRLKRKRKVELDGPGAERSLFPHKEICSLVSKSKAVRRFRTENSSFNKPLREKMGKKMVLALSALPPNEEGEILQTSNATFSMSSSISDEMGLDDMFTGGLLKTELDDLHKQLVEFPASATGVNLEDMKVIDLRAIAKEKKLKQYYKLPKKVLVEKIASSLDTC